MVLAIGLISWQMLQKEWIQQNQQQYSLIYRSADRASLIEYQRLIDAGISDVEAFFRAPFSQKFDVVIHPNRRSLDSTWQKEWNMPDFRSECWMVASGVAAKIDMIAPQQWELDACEHRYADTLKTRQLITHELVHVFHGQRNISPDFSNTEGLDWFIEGLAVFASGQLDSLRLTQVKNALMANHVPEGLDGFWSGKNRYGLSGSVVLFIDHKYGREKLLSLLPLNKKSDLLLALNTTETQLLNEWKSLMLNR